MKKNTVLVLALISILTMVAVTAMAPQTSRSIQFQEARFVSGKGVVFLFSTTGSFSNAELKTAVAYTGGQSLNTHCVVKNGMHKIACTVKLINQYVGQDVVIYLLEQGFWSTVPEKIYPCIGFTFFRSADPSTQYYVGFPPNFSTVDEYISF